MTAPFRSVTGIAIPFGMKNVDTDVIIPGRFLKTVTRSGLGKSAFAPLRESPANVFDSGRNSRAPILIAGDNFGCGSSREHAPWALVDMGLKVILAPSFADIFAGNAFKNGLLLVTLPQEAIDRLMEVAGEHPLTVDLETQRVTTPVGDSFFFTIDPFRRECLLNGYDETGITLSMNDEIVRHEAMQAERWPWVNGVAARQA